MTLLLSLPMTIWSLDEKDREGALVPHVLTFTYSYIFNLTDKLAGSDGDGGVIKNVNTMQFVLKVKFILKVKLEDWAGFPLTTLSIWNKYKDVSI